MILDKKLKENEGFVNKQAKEKPEDLLKIIDDLRKSQADSESQRKAIFNILEDVDESQEELKKRYSELNVIKHLVQELGNSLEIKTVINTLILSLKEIFPKEVNFIFVIPSSNFVNFSDSIYVHTNSSLGNKYLKTVKKNIMKLIDSTSDELKIKKSLVKWIDKEFLYEFVEGKKNDDDKAKPISIFNVSLVIQNELLGILNISSAKSGLFTKRDVDFVNTMVSITTDTISRLRQLLESEQSRLHSLVGSLSNGVIMFGLDKKVTMSNVAAQRMIGFLEKGLSLNKLVAILEDQDKKKINQKISEALKNGTTFSFEEIKISRFIYEFIIMPVHNNEMNIVGGAIILHDITHIKEIDRMKTEFVSVASHQLRTPLTAIMLFSEMFANEEVGKLSLIQKDYIENIQQSTKRMIRLVNDLLNVSRIETGRLKVDPILTELDEFIQSIIDESMPVITSKKGKLVFKKPAKKLSKIPIDQTLIQQVIHNLITNAIRYSPVDKCSILVKLEKKGDNYLISVKDNGIGIPKEAQERIFQKFFRADNAQKKEVGGSGLGLYVVKMIVETSGGKIWFKSEDGKGTTFFVSLPEKGMKIKKGEVGIITQ
ncbi:MAG: PAS domain S-box protein [Candidatus Pacebacteria bacterium]|nr:PAS domain S-box protein [Candidatus Paceibacterota bacterium]